MGKEFVLVWRGGGAAGCVAAGMAIALLKRGHIPRSMVGTSAGALNAFTLGFGQGNWRSLLEQWSSIKRERDVFSGHWMPRLPWTSGLKSSEPLRKRLQAFKDAAPCGKSSIPFEVATTSMRTGKIRYTKDSDADIVKMTTASASIPGYVDSIDPEGFCWADGGVKENLPLGRAIQTSGPDTIFICLHPFPLDPRIGDNWRSGNGIHNGLRGSQLQGEEILLGDMNPRQLQGINPRNVVHLAPDAVLVDVLDFNADKIAAGLEEGEVIGEDAASGIEELLK